MAKHRHDSPTTRRELLDAGRDLFSSKGYADARTVEIVARAGLTRGALYHHFGSKEGLFVEVLEEVHNELSAEVRRRAQLSNSSVVEAIRLGFQAWLDVALQPNVRQILLIDGPAVVGWETWHEIDLRHGFGITSQAVELAMEVGELKPASVHELTHVLLGAVTQAGLELSRLDNPNAARARYGKVIDLLLDGLLVEIPPPEKSRCKQ